MITVHFCLSKAYSVCAVKTSINACVSKTLLDYVPESHVLIFIISAYILTYIFRDKSCEKAGKEN